MSEPARGLGVVESDIIRGRVQIGNFWLGRTAVVIAGKVTPLLEVGYSALVY